MSIAGIFAMGGDCGHKDRHHHKKDHYSYGGKHDGRRGYGYYYHGGYRNYYRHNHNGGLLSGLFD